MQNHALHAPSSYHPEPCPQPDVAATAEASSSNSDSPVPRRDIPDSSAQFPRACHRPRAPRTGAQPILPSLSRAPHTALFRPRQTAPRSALSSSRASYPFAAAAACPRFANEHAVSDRYTDYLRPTSFQYGTPQVFHRLPGIHLRFQRSASAQFGIFSCETPRCRKESLFPPAVPPESCRNLFAPPGDCRPATSPRDWLACTEPPRSYFLQKK